jgi:CRISPR-associated exonuclease Cas4
MNTISISGVVACHRCPVRYYLEREMEGAESPRYTIAKQISYHLGEELDADQIWREVRTVAPELDPAMREELGEWTERCREGSWRRAVMHDVRVASEQLGIHGVVDRLFEGDPWFSIVRSSAAPPAGLYAGDRIRIACYTLCIRETLGLEVKGGVVEHIPSGTARLCIPQPRDRRAALRAIEAAKRVNRGEVPRKPPRAPCEHCPLEAHCTPGAKRLSDLL